MTCLSFENVFNYKSVFQALLPKMLFHFMRDFSELNILKVPPPVYMCISQSANCLEFVLDVILNKVNVYKICRSHILELELIN